MMAKIGLLQNFNLPGVACRRSAIDWSAENKIAVSTDKCIYVMSSYCSPLEHAYPLPLHKQVIKPPTEIMDFQTVDPEKLMRHLTREDMYAMMLDHTLSPKTSNSAPFLGYRNCRWSPKGASGAGRCILASLTMDHRLCLYKEKRKDWSCICDLSTELLKLHKEICQPFLINNDQTNRVEVSASLLHKLKEKTYALATMEICWTGMFHTSSAVTKDGGHEWCYLISSTRSGRIVCWRISHNAEKFATLEFEHDTSLGLITSLYWQQTNPTSGFLVAGSLKGQLAIFPASLNCGTNEKEPKLCLKEMQLLWQEHDRISVDIIAVLKTSMRKYVVLATKKHYLTYGEVAWSAEMVSISKVGCSSGLHGTPATGFVTLSPTMPQSQLLLSSCEGKLVKVKVVSTAKAIECHHEELPVNIKVENMMIQGIAISQNGVLCSAILNTAVYRDHLMQREPLQFVMFLNKDFETAISEFHTVLKPQFSFLPVVNRDICKYSDYLECVRAVLAFGYRIPEWFVSLLKMDREDFEKQSQLELYFTRYLMKCAVTVLLPAALADYGDLVQKLSVLDSMIMRNYIFKVLGNFQDKLDLLTPSQSTSLLLMVDFLFKEHGLQLENVYAAFGLECPSSVQDVPSRENCVICDSEVKFENLKFGKCQKNHEISRCCLSLLLCFSTPYLQCNACKSMALIQDVWGVDSTCTYCCSLMYSF